MRRESFLTLLLFVVSVLADKSTSTVVVEHRLGDSGPWSKRCEVVITKSDRGKISATVSSAGQATIDASTLGHAAASWYSLRIPSSNPDYPWLVTSTRATCLTGGGAVSDSIAIHVGTHGQPVSISYACSIGGGGRGDVSFDTSVSVFTPVVAMVPPQETATDRLPPGAPNPEEENKPGFFAKYWWIILPVGLMLLLQTVLGPMLGGGGGGEEEGSSGQRQPTARR